MSKEFKLFEAGAEVRCGCGNKIFLSDKNVCIGVDRTKSKIDTRLEIYTLCEKCGNKIHLQRREI